MWLAPIICKFCLLKLLLVQGFLSVWIAPYLCPHACDPSLTHPFWTVWIAPYVCPSFSFLFLFLSGAVSHCPLTRTFNLHRPSSVFFCLRQKADIYSSYSNTHYIINKEKSIQEQKSNGLCFFVPPTSCHNKKRKSLFWLTTHM